ncbi:unnamed protein product [Arabis nemorensis]|uniref:Uncharacterized protein n=1 Tax=Arabis nemorensis TaxID=586526 RepID=A0A565ATV9_9BRAS|nr:unnamed protein product [Arabis nemorensis]
MDHPCARPCEVDSDVEQKWRMFEIKQDRGDVINTIRSTSPGANGFWGLRDIERCKRFKF